jgi:SAM-dependent methyltransferase
MSDNTTERCEAAYADDNDLPPWAIGEPQPEVVALIERGLITGRLLDSGCGTGEHTLIAAERGATVTGVDISRSVIETARRKAAHPGINAEFAVVNMLEPVPFDDDTFDTVLDSGVFHSFEGRPNNARMSTTSRGWRSQMGGSTDLLQRTSAGRGRVGSPADHTGGIRAAFSGAWSVDEIQPAIYRINKFHDTTEVKAWRALLRRRP